MTGSHISPRFSVTSFKVEGSKGEFLSVVLLDTYNQHTYSLIGVKAKQIAAWIASREPAVDPRETLLKLYRIVHNGGRA